MSMGTSFETENVERYTTQPMTPVEQNNNSYFIPLNENKPCLSIVQNLPDARIRLFRINMLTKIYESLVIIFHRLLNDMWLFKLIITSLSSALLTVLGTKLEYLI